LSYVGKKYLLKVQMCDYTKSWNPGQGKDFTTYSRFLRNIY